MPADKRLYQEETHRDTPFSSQPSRAPRGLPMHEVTLGAAADAVAGPLLGVDGTDAGAFPTAASVTPDANFVDAEELAYTEGADGVSVDVVIYERDADGNTGAEVLAFTSDAATPLALTTLAASTAYSLFIRGIDAAGRASQFRRVDFTTNAA